MFYGEGDRVTCEYRISTLYCVSSCVYDDGNGIGDSNFRRCTGDIVHAHHCLRGNHTRIETGLRFDHAAKFVGAFEVKGRLKYAFRNK